MHNRFCNGIHCQYGFSLGEWILLRVAGKKHNHVDFRLRDALLYIGLLCCALASLYMWWKRSPPLLDHRTGEPVRLRLPRSPKDVMELRDSLVVYQRDYPMGVLGLYCGVYITMQSFAIPGSFSLSVLAGSLFGIVGGCAVVCFCCGVGSTICYVISRVAGRALVYRVFPEKMELLCAKVDEHRDNLMFFMIFLRVTPLVPNWFVNIASPMLPVPFYIYALGTVLGVIPQTLVAVHAGQSLREFSSLADIISIRTFFFFLALSFVALLPVILRRKEAAGTQKKAS